MIQEKRYVILEEGYVNTVLLTNEIKLIIKQKK